MSLEDDLMRIFAGDKIQKVMERLKVPDDQPIEAGIISKSIESAQKKVEGHNFDIRKHVVEYDDVMNAHRDVIYTRRRKILEKGDLKADIIDMFTQEIDLLLAAHAASDDRAEWGYDKISEGMAAIVTDRRQPGRPLKQCEDRDELRHGLQSMMVGRAYGAKESEQGEEQMRTLERMVMLRTIDALWVDHLDSMEHLREGIGLRGYGQRDPLTEYKGESFRLFETLLGQIQGEVTHTIFKVSLITAKPTSEMEQAAKSVQTAKSGDTGARPVKPVIGKPEPGEEPVDEPAKASTVHSPQSTGSRSTVAGRPSKQEKAEKKTKTQAAKEQPTPKTKEPEPKPEPKAEEPPKEEPKPEPEPEKPLEPTPAPTPPPQPDTSISAEQAEALASTPSVTERKQEGSATITVKQRTAPPPNPATPSEVKVGRNDPCPCGSGLKYKKCGLINSPEHQKNTAG